jgi:ribonuclease Z
MIDITILGNNSALPAHGRWPTSQIVAIRDYNFLVDCGEGTQMLMQQYGKGWGKLHHIFISHLHGDHYYGLIGLLTSMNLLGRTMPLHIYASPELEAIINAQISIGGGKLNYDLLFHTLVENSEIVTLLDEKYFKVEYFPVQHRIPCYGFKFTAKTTGRKIDPEMCRHYGVPTYFYSKLKEGQDYESSIYGLVKNEWVTKDGPKSPQYAYCADTLYFEEIIPYIKDVDTIYYETTFLKCDEERATLRYHSTTHQAAKIAQLAQVKRLLIGHYSSRYSDVHEFELEAREIFANTFATSSGHTFQIFYNQD